MDIVYLLTIIDKYYCVFSYAKVKPIYYDEANSTSYAHE